MDRRTFIGRSSAVGMAGLLGLDQARLLGESATQPAGSALVISDITVFDSTRQRWNAAQTVVIQGDRIESVGRRDPSTIPDGADVLEGHGKYLIPGLIDAHVHLTHILFQSRMTGDEILPLFLANGVTTVRSTGDNVPAQRLIQRYAIEHSTICPRTFLCSFLIDGAHVDHPDVGWSLTAPEEVPPFVAHMAGWGVTTLKIYVGCEPPVGRAVITEGHKHGLVVTGHLTAYHPAAAAEDGIDCLEHIYTVADFIRADPEDRHSVDLSSDAAKRLVDTIAQHDVFVDPTLMVFWGTLFFVDDPQVIEHPDNVSMPQRLREFWLDDNPRRLQSFSSGPLAVRRATFQTYKRLVGMLHRAGVRILVGTDAPEPQVPPGSSLHHEMEFLVESGMTPAEVLSAATSSNAQILKESDNLGSIEPGKLADLVVLEANPLEDITNTRKIHRVIKGGKLLVPEVILRNAPQQ